MGQITSKQYSNLVNKMAWPVLSFKVSLQTFKERIMTQSALTFFVLAIFTVLAGSYGISGASIEVVKVLSIIFLTLGVFSFVGSLINQKKSKFEKH